MQTFRVNDNITLKLEDNKTNVYVKGEMPRQCKYLFLNIAFCDISLFDDVESIDEGASDLNHEMELQEDGPSLLPPDVELWGHCSKIQVWAENYYDFRLLPSKLAFLLLKRLIEVGDHLAQIKFKENLVQKLLSCDLKVTQY